MLLSKLAVYQDLCTHHDWPVKKAIVNLPIRLKRNFDTLSWLFSETIGGQNKDTLTIWELDYVCAAGSVDTKNLGGSF